MNFCAPGGRKADAFQRRKRENSPQEQVFGILCLTLLSLTIAHAYEHDFRGSLSASALLKSSSIRKD